MFRCLFPIGHLGVVGAVEVVTAYGIEVVERSDGECRPAQCFHAIGDDKVIGRVFVGRELQCRIRVSNGPSRLMLDGLAVHGLDLL